MAGGLMQLVYIGKQDRYFTGDPQITFFKQVYKRHTNFSMSPISVDYNGAIEVGSTVRSLISRDGDLLNDIWLEYQHNTLDTRVSGLSLISSVNFKIGGVVIDSQDFYFMHGSGRVFSSTGKLKLEEGLQYLPFAQVDSKVIIPLKFWFCRYMESFIPLLALQYHEVELEIKLANDMLRERGYGASEHNEYDIPNEGFPYTPTKNSLKKFKIMCNYIYLDTPERKYFAENAHEYLIETTGIQGPIKLTETNAGSNNTSNINLKSKYSVKHMFWFIGNKFGEVPDQNGPNCIKMTSANLVFNNKNLMPAETTDYYTHLNPFLHKTGNVKNSSSSLNYYNNQAVTNFSTLKSYIGTATGLYQDSNLDSQDNSKGYQYYSYSFALNPTELEPSGSCNFSQIVQKKLNVTYHNYGTTNSLSSFIYIYTTNYNILKIESGMGGLLYTN